MEFIKQTPKLSLNKGFLKQPVLRHDIDVFKTNLVRLLSKIDEIEREENQKNHIRDFLLNTYYKETNEINTKDSKDLVIHLGRTNKDKVGVIIEAKRPSNRNEMFSLDKPNCKALGEIILYYFHEREQAANNELKNLIITNIYEWYIFDANDFDKDIYRNTKIKKLYATYVQDRKDTTFFYEEVRKIIDHSESEIHYTYFDIRDYEQYLNNNDLADDKNLIALQKLLSPIFLLKEPYADDSNSLNLNFYRELLHILGLEEVKSGGKNIIQRKEKNRDSASLLELAIDAINTKNVYSHITDLSSYGDNQEEREFNIALELCLTWINRILFLKLLEGQLMAYHQGNKDYSFLNLNVIKDFDGLFNLFHRVLNIEVDKRNPKNTSRFSHIPYLNSSLFEISELEDKTISIESLQDDEELELLNNTILFKLRFNKGRLGTLEYLLRFLDAYDFASESIEAIQEESKSLINASVLGKVFEKINGYKDGSIFTPGFITMYMSRESLRLAVVEKFKEKYSWNIAKFDDIKNYLADRKSTTEILEFNELLNTLRICDPAVGSGHFLVSVLNEIIAIKYELGILADSSGTRIRDCNIVIDNDELVITNDFGDIFEYMIQNGKPINDRIQLLQKTLFHEKQTIIENCLYGVDINPNSVKISCLRLWIELLKNTYYKETNNFRELETLPNIDINIKTGNSLLSRYKLKDEFNQRDLRILEEYKIAVSAYKSVKNRDDKSAIRKVIDICKDKFKGMWEGYKSPDEDKLSVLASKLHHLISLNGAFEDESALKKRAEEKEKITKQIEELRAKVDENKKNPIFKKAFEWRFEFPEVLNDEGNFVGFDVVIGNPPYIQLQKDGGSLAKVLEIMNYETFTNTGDIYSLFYEKGWQVLKPNGLLCFITSNKWMRAGYGEKTRAFLVNKTNPIELIDFGGFKVFDNATVDTNILLFSKSLNQGKTKACTIDNDFNNKVKMSAYFSQKLSETKFDTSQSWVIMSGIEERIKAKIESAGTRLKDWNVNIYRGVLTGLNEAFIIDGKEKAELIVQDPKSAEIIKPILRGRDIKRYKAEFADLWLIMFPKGFTIKSIQSQQQRSPFSVSEPMPRYGYEEYDDAWHFIKTNYSAIANHLIKYKDKAEMRDDKGDYWWELRACAYLEEFEKEKVVWKRIGSVLRFQYDNFGSLCLDSTCFLTSNENEIKYLTALMNSTISYKFLLDNSPKTGTGDVITSVQAIEPLLIPKISPEAQQPFIDLVDKILSKKERGEDTSREEKRIDLITYKLYKLTYDEVKIVEPEFATSREEYEQFKIKE